MAQRDFARKHLPDYPLFKLVSLFYEVVPPVLTAGGKVRCPLRAWRMAPPRGTLCVCRVQHCTVPAPLAAAATRCCALCRPSAAHSPAEGHDMRHPAADARFRCHWTRAGEEPVAQRRRAFGRAAAVLRHDGSQLLHRALRRVACHRRAVAGVHHHARLLQCCVDWQHPAMLAFWPVSLESHRFSAVAPALRTALWWCDFSPYCHFVLRPDL